VHSPREPVRKQQNLRTALEGETNQEAITLVLSKVAWRDAAMLQIRVIDNVDDEKLDAAASRFYRDE
jgi:hypothetical protein